eukprot:Lithocolla_globosa_v1_NODE_259_length_4780_cov_16.351111.p3 type:complete len:274 gc:universal NODE_259_length_4780_cov_16.351111:3757-4578(+)
MFFLSREFRVAPFEAATCCSWLKSSSGSSIGLPPLPTLFAMCSSTSKFRIDFSLSDRVRACVSSPCSVAQTLSLNTVLGLLFENKSESLSLSLSKSCNTSTIGSHTQTLLSHSQQLSSCSDSLEFSSLPLRVELVLRFGFERLFLCSFSMVLCERTSAAWLVSSLSLLSEGWLILKDAELSVGERELSVGEGELSVGEVDFAIPVRVGFLLSTTRVSDTPAFSNEFLASSSVSKPWWTSPCTLCTAFDIVPCPSEEISSVSSTDNCPVFLSHG